MNYTPAEEKEIITIAYYGQHCKWKSGHICDDVDMIEEENADIVINKGTRRQLIKLAQGELNIYKNEYTPYSAFVRRYARNIIREVVVYR